MTASERECLLCEQVEEAERFGGGPLIGDDLVVAYHLPPSERYPLQYLGRVQVVTRRHVDHLSDLTEAETVAAALAARRITQGLRAMDDVDRVHLALIGQHHPHFHLHVYPRYAWMPRDADWNALSMRDDAPRGGAPEIIDFIGRLRPLVPLAHP
jgi:diadenosine tetraphosphate (Ap4A) HIT family hydrolase